jgi:hypothetical protein
LEKYVLGVQIFRGELERARVKLSVAQANVGRARAGIRNKGLPIHLASVNYQDDELDEHSDASDTEGDEDG